MASAGSGANVNGEVAKLFARLTLDQVTEREAQLRVDIERKQQQLRHLVSDRYRDLVGSADALKRMQQESRRVVGHIERARAVRTRDEHRKGDHESGEWQLACLARQLLQLEASAWHDVAQRRWREAGERVREGMRLMEASRAQLAARVPVVMAGPLGDGRLLQQIVGEAHRRLAAPSVLSGEEKASLCACVGSDEALLRGRLRAFEAALATADYLPLCCALLEESHEVEGYLEAAASLAAARMPPVTNLAAAIARLSTVQSGLWEQVMGPALLKAMRSAVSEQLHLLLLSCTAAEDAAAALKTWFQTGLSGLGAQPWARKLRLFAVECGKEALASLAGRWEEEARAQWAAGGARREQAALHCALRLQALDKAALLLAPGSSGGGGSVPLSRAARETLLRAQHQQAGAAGASSADVWLTGWACCAVARLSIAVPDYSTSAGGQAPQHPSTAVVASVFAACATLLECPTAPSWLAALVAQLLSLRMAALIEPLCSVFGAQLHLDLLFLDAALANASASPVAAAAAARLSLPDPSGDGTKRPFLRMAAALVARADAIDGAYSQLHAPQLASAAVARCAALLQPLLPAGTAASPAPLSIGGEGEMFSLARPQRVAYPFRSLPLASRRVLTNGGIVVPDDEEETAVVARPSSSLFQRLGSQLW